MNELTIAIAMTHPGLYLPPRPSDSVARVIENQIQGLNALGHRILLLGPEDSRAECELIPVCKKPVSIESDPDGKKANEIARKTREEIWSLRNEIDIVHAHSLDIPGLLFTSDFLNDCPVPHVTTMHSCVELSNLKLFETCEGPMISLSYNQRDACPFLDYVGNVYNGLDINCFPRVEESKGYLCFLGRITPEKQPHLALELAAYLDMPIKLAGPIVNQEYFEKMCRPFLKGRKAEYLGELDMDGKIELLAYACCNLHPTGFRDPCPLVPMEAGICGTPTLAIRRGALPELIEDGVTGVLAEDFTEAACKVKDCMLLNRKKIADISRKKFSHMRMAQDYVKIYHKILDGKGSLTRKR